MSGLTFLMLVMVVGTTIWVGVDASKRSWGNDSGTTTWVVGCILLWILVFPLYLAKRGKAPLKGSEGFMSAGVAPLPNSRPATYRECPHCKEQMRRDARVCAHCRNESAAWQWDGQHWLVDGPSGRYWLDEARNEWVAADVATPTTFERAPA